MDTIQHYPEATSNAGDRRFWRPKSRSKASVKRPSKPRGRPFTREVDWHMVALVGAGVAAGAVLGAGIALLAAPQSGAHTRLALSRELRRRRPWRDRGPWDQLGRELRRVARARNALSRSSRRPDDE